MFRCGTTRPFHLPGEAIQKDLRRSTSLSASLDSTIQDAATIFHDHMFQSFFGGDEPSHLIYLRHFPFHWAGYIPDMKKSLQKLGAF